MHETINFKKYKPLTQEQIKQHLEAGYNIKTLSKKVNLEQRTFVIKYREEIFTVIQDLLEAGQKKTNIAKKIGIDRGTLRSWIKNPSIFINKNDIANKLNNGMTITQLAKITKLKPLELVIKFETELVKKAIPLLKKGDPLSEVGRKLGVHHLTVRNWVENYKLEWNNFDSRKGDQSNITHEFLNDIYTAFVNGEAMISISKKHKGLSKEKVRDFLIDAGFEIVNFSKSKINNHANFHAYKPFSQYLQELQEGELLGDANINIRSNRKISKENLHEFLNQDLIPYYKGIEDLEYLRQLQINTKNIENVTNIYNNLVRVILNQPTGSFSKKQSILEENWVKHINKQFLSENIQTNISYDHYLSDGVNRMPRILLLTQSTVQFFVEYIRWYGTGKKRVPMDLKLSPTSILHWYMGDGELSNDPVRIDFHTEGFEKAEVEFLIDLFHAETGIEAYVAKSFNNTDDSWAKIDVTYMMRIGGIANVKKFFQYLRKVDKTSLKIAKKALPYKFDLTLTKTEFLTSP